MRTHLLLNGRHTDPLTSFALKCKQQGTTAPPAPPPFVVVVDCVTTGRLSTRQSWRHPPDKPRHVWLGVPRHGRPCFTTCVLHVLVACDLDEADPEARLGEEGAPCVDEAGKGLITERDYKNEWQIRNCDSGCACVLFLISSAHLNAQCTPMGRARACVQMSGRRRIDPHWANDERAESRQTLL